MPSPLPSAPTARSPSRGKLRRQSGFTLTEVVVAAAVIVIFGASLIGALLATQRLTAASRVMTSARVIVQRNIDTALGVKFTSASEPDILLITTDPNGTAFGDYSDTSETPQPTTNPLPIHITKIGNTLVSGRLTRIVKKYNTSVPGLDVREITFRIDYRFGGRDYSYFMTTLRARDDQS